MIIAPEMGKIKKLFYTTLYDIYIYIRQYDFGDMPPE